MLLKTYSCFLLVFLSCSVFAQQKNRQALRGDELKPTGRTRVTADHELDLIGSASHFSVSFEGKECTVFVYSKASGGHNYLQYEMDGSYQKRIRISDDSVQAISLLADKKGIHTLTLYKATEAQTGPVYIQKISGYHVQNVLPLQQPLIEFIGNSITCGAASDTSEVACGKGLYHDQHNAYYAYGPRVARALHLNYMLSSVSGIGIYRNWNSDGPTMPQVYEKSDLTFDSTQLWRFATYSPAIVSIALGTNDMSRGDGVKPRLPFDSAQFVSHYIAFVKLVKSKYPKAQIALLSSPMIHGADRELLQHCLSAVKQSADALYPSAKHVAVYFFSPMQAGGCGGHPSVEDHGKMADELVPFFKGLL